MKKYKLTANFIIHFGRKLYQIKAIRDFGKVKAGEVGGYIEKEENLDQSGDAWVFGNAVVYGDARISDGARVYGDAWVYGNAVVSGNAEVYDNARVAGDAVVSGNARVYDGAWVFGNARVAGDAVVSGNAKVIGDAEVLESTHLLQIDPIGSRNDLTTFFRTKTNDLYVACGCFLGSIEEFKERVMQKHTGTKHEKTYLLAIELAKLQIELDRCQ